MSSTITLMGNMMYKDDYIYIQYVCMYVCMYVILCMLYYVCMYVRMYVLRYCQKLYFGIFVKQYLGITKY